MIYSCSHFHSHSLGEQNNERRAQTCILDGCIPYHILFGYDFVS